MWMLGWGGIVGSMEQITTSDLPLFLLGTWSKRLLLSVNIEEPR